MGDYKEKLVDPARNRYPFCVVWTPIPVLSWLFPFIGHIGIASSLGIIRDFAGPYYVSEDCMSFGNPTKYWQLNLDNVVGGEPAFDRGVASASEEYQKHNHNLCCDNCHSHVALALNTMAYDHQTNWNMLNLCILFLLRSKYLSLGAFVKTWLPFFVIVVLLLLTVFIL